MAESAPSLRLLAAWCSRCWFTPFFPVRFWGKRPSSPVLCDVMTFNCTAPRVSDCFSTEYVRSRRKKSPKSWFGHSSVVLPSASCLMCLIVWSRKQISNKSTAASFVRLQPPLCCKFAAQDKLCAIQIDQSWKLTHSHSAVQNPKTPQHKTSKSDRWK
jgi:hypothetical protein